jgi:SRSO17 transposase
VHVPDSLAGLLSLLRPCFTQPSFQNFIALTLGLVGRIGERTITGMWQAAALAGRVHHARAHRFFSRARWSADELGLRLLDFLVTVFVAGDAPLRLADDDTLFGRSGRTVYGCFFHHDGAAPPGEGHRSRWGNNWVVVGLLVRLPVLDRVVCLPVLFRLWRPDRKPARGRGERRAKRQRSSQSELARTMVDLAIARFAGRGIEVVFDAAYLGRAWRGLPEHVTITGRLRRNARLHAPAPPRTGRRGRPRTKGERLPTLAEIATASTTAWQPVNLVRDGRATTILVALVDGLWYDALGAQRVRVALCRDDDTAEGFDVALLTTDVAASPQRIVDRYSERWAIEVRFQDAKRTTGVGEARNRLPRAVLRTVPFGFLTQTLVTAWCPVSRKWEGSSH